MGPSPAITRTQAGLPLLSPPSYQGGSSFLSILKLNQRAGTVRKRGSAVLTLSLHFAYGSRGRGFTTLWDEASGGAGVVWTFDEYVLDFARRELYRGASRIELEPQT